jgi:hypothetical protein
MSLFDFLQKFLWFFPIGVEFVTVIALFKRGLYRELPIFTAYLTFVCVHDLALATLFEPFSVAYFYAYWSTELISIVLGFAVLYEVFNSVLKPYPSIQRLASILFCIASIAFLGTAVFITSAASQGQSHSLVSAILMAEFAMRIIQTGLALFLFLFASALGLTWRHFIFGVAIGFGLYAATELIIVASRSYFGAAQNSVSMLLKPAAFTCSVVIWSLYLLRKEPVTIAPLAVPDTYNIAAWNQTLSEYLHQ